MNEIVVRIRFLLPSLPKIEKRVAQAILEHPEGIEEMTLAELARETNSSDASIIRFCKRLGLAGYTELKKQILFDSNAANHYVEEQIESDDSMTEILKKVFQSNVRALEDTLVLASDEYEKALAALLKTKSISFFGVGDAAAVCQLAHMKFGKLGYRTSCHTDNVFQLMEAGNLRRGDVAFAISYEGRSKNIVEAMRVARARGATTIALTKMNKSPLLRFTDIVLFIATNDLTVCRDIVARRVADQMIIDTLYLGVLAKTNDEKKQYLKDMRRIIDHNKLMKKE